MSFFDNPRNAGLALMIVSIIDIIGGIALIILGAIGYEGYNTVHSIILGVGEIICGALMFMYGQKVRGGAISAKIEILAQFVRVIGVITIIGGIFAAIANIAIGVDLGASIVGAIVAIILGLIIMFIGSKINDGKQTIGDKIIWIILLIAFVIMILIAIVEIISIIGIINGICDLIVYIFMLILLVDPEVKKEMNM